MWRQRGSRSWLLFGASVVLSVLGLAMKNDALLGVLVIVAWEWLIPRSQRERRRTIVTGVVLLPAAAFLWWQATAVDPHRDHAQTGLAQVASNSVKLLRFIFLWRNDSELRAEFPPGPPPPIALTVLGGMAGTAVLILAALSLRDRAGRVLVFAGLASLGPVAVLNPAVVSRYTLPTTLLITAAAGAGAALLATSRGGAPRHALATSRGGTPRRVLALGAGLATIAVWGTLAHLASGDGAVAGREEQALLSGLTAAALDPSQDTAVLLTNSPLDPSTAAFRQGDPTLPQRLHRLTFLLPGQTPPPGMRWAVANRLPTGVYQVRLGTGTPLPIARAGEVGKPGDRPHRTQ
jgi:hypothetical protein